MPVYREEEPVERVYRVEEEPAVVRRVVEEPVVERRVVEEPVVERRVIRTGPGNDMTSFALIKYGFILAITIVILWFIGKYFLPTFF